MLVVIEVATHSPRVSRLLQDCGHEVIVATARKVRLIYGSDNKTDEVDAESLARLGGLDPKLLAPTRHRGAESQADLAMIRSRDCQTKRLRQIAGVGPITSLCFVLTLEDPERFPSSRSVGPYLGLRPRRRDSGAHSPQLRITKSGDAMLRRLLVGSAHYILGPFGPDCDLRRQGLKLAARGGKNAKKRAVVAVARRLACMLHSIWINDNHYEPFRWENRTTAAKNRETESRWNDDYRLNQRLGDCLPLSCSGRCLVPAAAFDPLRDRA